ncbi:WD40 repeat-like protein [Suillus hirtellus]|nr:WD40 repeat-like protein [Suillus hirtellus]
MPHKKSESSTSTRRGKASLRSSIYRTSAKYLPPYGAQHRQDALWEGGNKALPPMWQQFKRSSIGETVYQDDRLTMVSWNRPLPGVRLDSPGDLAVPGCEWHMSPLGRSYFVNHNTRTTSWRKPKPKRPAGSLMPECVIEGHSKCIWSLAYLGTSGNIMSTSDDSSIRQWKGDGEPVGKPLISDGGGVVSMAVSPYETMVVCGSGDGRLRLWNIKEGSMIGDPWEGHRINTPVRCLDWSRNSLEIASGSQDGTIRRWNPDTGRQIAPLIRTSHGWIYAVKYCPQGDKFISGGTDNVIRVWSRNGKLLIEIKGHGNAVTSLCWSKDGAHIFSGSADSTIRKWRAIDGQELIVFRGHTNYVQALCLTPDESYIVSASNDCSIRIWDLQTNQAVGDPLLYDDRVFAIAISREGKYIASAGLDKNIHVWNLEAALKVVGANAKLKARPTQPRVVRPPIDITKGSAKYGDDLFANDSDRAGSLRFSTQPTDTPRPSPRESRHRNFSLLPPKTRIGTRVLSDTRAQSSPNTKDEAPTRPRRDVRNVSGTDVREGTETGATVESNTTSRDHAPSPEQTRAPSHTLQDLTDELQGRSRYPITSGGFGDIWKCDLVKPDMTVQVAVKTIRAFESDDEVLMRKNSRRVRRELKVWGRLKHDTILPLWGVATDFGPYPAMICPWAENGALTGYLERQESSLSSHDKFSLVSSASSISRGLLTSLLHNKSVVHGDLTGSNVLIYGNGRACLADFGLSTIILEFVGTSYFTSSIRGNVRWVAAELCEVSEDEELSLTTECDIYSFGSIMLQVLTCKVPYHNVKKDIAVLGQVIKGIKPQPPKESQIGPGHWEFMQRCWLPRASRPSVAEIVTFIACERQSVSS